MSHLLVVGGAGFIGRHLLEAWLSQSGNRATVLDNGSGPLGFSRLDEWLDSDRLQVMRQDIRDRIGLTDLFEQQSFDAVVQLCCGQQPGPAALSRRETLDTMARGTQYLIEGLAANGCDTPFYQLISTAPWGDDPQRSVSYGSSVRPASLMGVAESIAMEVSLGLSRELGIRAQVWVAPLAFGAFQIAGPVPEFIARVLNGQGHTQNSSKADWRLIYAPDLAKRLLHAIEHPVPGDVVRLPGLSGMGWEALSRAMAELMQRFNAANPALSRRFPDADWHWRLGIEHSQHPGWPEVVVGGEGAIEYPETPWPQALAQTLRWYLTYPQLWQGKVAPVSGIESEYAPAI